MYEIIPAVEYGFIRDAEGLRSRFVGNSMIGGTDTRRAGATEKRREDYGALHQEWPVSGETGTQDRGAKLDVVPDHASDQINCFKSSVRGIGGYM